MSPNSNSKEQSVGDAPEELAWPLTARQLQVLELLSKGHSNKVIGRSLGISPSTVKVHLQAAYQTLRVQSRVAATVALADYKARFHLMPDVEDPMDEQRSFEGI